jgi:hypothetical protein
MFISMEVSQYKALFIYKKIIYLNNHNTTSTTLIIADFNATKNTWLEGGILSGSFKSQIFNIEYYS